jgi:outer membrane immunogenic protein
MKHISLGVLGVSAVLVASLSSATAADLPFKAPPVVAPVAYDWSGVYFGGNIGGGWSSNDFSDPGLAIVGTLLGVPVTQTVNSSGFLGGAQVGTNYQIGKLVVGVEGDWDWSRINGGNTTAFGPFLAPPILNRTLTADTDWTATATTRIGFAHDNWLFYGKAGGAWEHTKYSDTWALGPGLGPLSGFPLFTGTGSQTRPGWTVGTGVEYAFWNNWSAKLEYDFMDFGSNTDTISGRILPTVFGGIPASFGVQNNQQISEVKFGINYKFMPNFW